MKRGMPLISQPNLRAALRAALLAVGITAVLCAGPVLADESSAADPRVLPPNSTPFELSYPEWHTAYWNWVMSIPAEINPSLQADDDSDVGPTPTLVPWVGPFDASVGQMGHVWFLPETHGWDVVRNAVIPAGTPLCVCLQSYLVWGWPNVPPAVAAFTTYANDVMDTAEATCEIDGVPVNDLDRYTAVSPVTPMVLPENNLPGLDAGPYGMMIDFGTFLLLAPLPVGEHTIHWNAAFTLLPPPPPPGGPPPPEPPYPRASQDVTYRITVVPRQAP
jgi:hypothetical protein